LFLFLSRFLERKLGKELRAGDIAILLKKHSSIQSLKFFLFLFLSRFLERKLGKELRAGDIAILLKKRRSI
jgi:hypothetical protein